MMMAGKQRITVPLACAVILVAVTKVSRQPLQSWCKLASNCVGQVCVFFFGSRQHCCMRPLCSLFSSYWHAACHSMTGINRGYPPISRICVYRGKDVGMA
ncbi:hypothetical protein COO60DRAFT_34200 [Scenedesmus sp. NREL 46B-D3]|nr:hypothetical protein COO60DRAFT_34200 [Scenedesmus sp. NREL 46B-D3]